MRGLPDHSVDSVVTDPPYGLSKEPDIREVLAKWMANEPYDHGHGGFMGKAWDSFVPGPAIWREVYRVLKPGAHLLCFAGTRTQDLMSISLRLAGFEVRDVIEWLYFSGFPKSLDVGKAFDKRAGAEREVVGQYSVTRDFRDISGGQYGNKTVTSKAHAVNITAPATELAKKWDGWGTALKPAHEPIIVARKPLAGTVVETVEKYGTGAINIDGCRIPFGEDIPKETSNQNIRNGAYMSDNRERERDTTYVPAEQGRFPANIVTTDDDAFYSKYANVTPPELCKKASKWDRNSDWRGEKIKEVYTWEGVDLNPLMEKLNQHLKDIFDDTTQSTDAHAWSTLLFGKSITDRTRTGTKYITLTEISLITILQTWNSSMHSLTKESIRDVLKTITENGINLAESAAKLNELKRNTTDTKTEYRLGVVIAALETLSKIKESARKGNVHSTVKPTDLMAWLVRLVTPPGGTVLDPFAGSGSTLVAAKREGFGYIGIEREPDYVEIAKARTGEVV